jgi:hypothetical protein
LNGPFGVLTIQLDSHSRQQGTESRQIFLMVGLIEHCCLTGSVKAGSGHPTQAVIDRDVAQKAAISVDRRRWQYPSQRFIDRAPAELAAYRVEGRASFGGQGLLQKR